MHWIALPWPHDEAPLPARAGVPTASPHAWWALRWTPRVAVLDEALLLEVSSTERLWGGSARLMAQLQASRPTPDGPWAEGATALAALALLRLREAGQAVPAHVPQGLPLHTLSAARPHAASLARMGCNTWGGLRALPRAGIARRFGASLLQALDQGWGDAPDALAWLTLPATFDMALELPAPLDSAPALLHAADRLLSALQSWLRARQQGVLVLELVWQHDLRRYNGVDLPAQQALAVCTAQPTQELAHLRRLLAEHLARTTLAAPANQVRLRVRQAVALPHTCADLLPVALGAEPPGEPLHQLVERLVARLGAGRVQAPVLHADHRPECMQRWQAPGAALAQAGPPSAAPLATHGPDFALLPPWLLRLPLRLAVQGHRPCHHGPLSLLAGPQRIEAGWWSEAGPEGVDPDGQGGSAVRDYFVAHNDSVGLVWVFRERLGSQAPGPQRWFLHGFYA